MVGTPDQDASLDRTLKELERRQVQLEQAERKLEKRRLVGRSTDRLVTIRARALGEITSVEFHPAIFDEHDEESLAAAVLEAITDVTRRAATAFQETFGDLMAFPELDAADGADREDEFRAVPTPATAVPAAAAPAAPAAAAPAAPATVRHAARDLDTETTAAAAAVASWAGAGVDTEQAEAAALGRRSRRAKVDTADDPRPRSRTSRKRPEQGAG